MKMPIVDFKEYMEVLEEVRGLCTGCDLFEGDCDNKRVDSCIANNVILKQIPKKSKPKNKVKFFRYHRPLDPKTNFAKSDMGVTFFIKINYKKRTMRVSASVCNGDNFSKEVGKIQSRTRYDFGRYLEFPLNDYTVSEESVLDYLRITLDNKCHLPEFDAAVKQLRLRRWFE